MKRYRAKKEYVLREIADTSVLVAVGAGVADFSGVIILNDSAKALWVCLQEGSDAASLCDALQEKFHISKEQAEKDVEDTLKLLTARRMIEEYE
ncbi:MAG: PqqD family protein [Lachnospiraceae bacterium]|nr:PqqD family protein [Lachnospiraceae bacterium]